jgi:hypothetical protein
LFCAVANIPLTRLLICWLFISFVLNDNTILLQRFDNSKYICKKMLSCL